MKFDSARHLEELIWNSRIADLPRASNRAILQRMYGGEPPFDETSAEENGIQVNRNDLTGVNLMSQARNQWNSAFLNTRNYFTVTLDCGPSHKRHEWGAVITRHINQRLKRCPKMLEQIRATGANVMLHGIGPTNWPDRRSPIPSPLPISSLLIPSETDIDFENLEWFAIFREWTPAQLYLMTHGPKVDPGWNMALVKSQLRYIAEQVQKRPNATAYQYMPERVEELVKQDLGYWGSDAVPTIDVWDVYFREADDGKGWYRRILLDWGIGASQMSQSLAMPDSRNRVEGKDEFIYTSGERKYADCHREIFHCNFGDTSAYAPFKYHSVRSLGWMLWGACDLQNRLYCKFMENAFTNLMWWFRVSGEQMFSRIKRADFFHMGVIPNGVTIIPNQERFQPDSNIINLAFSINRSLIAEQSASFTSDFARGDDRKGMTATETMARVNSVNALVSGMLTLAYTYEEFKYREIARRFCIKNNPDKLVREFRAACLRDGVPSKYLDSDMWNIEAERVVGTGNKTLEMAAIQFLNSIRKNMGPRGQRIIDHMSVFAATDQPALAEEIAPLNEEKPISDSMHDAQISTQRLMAGLPLVLSPKMIPEEYVRVWLADMAMMIQQANNAGGMATQEQIMGWGNMAQHVQQFLGIMAADEEQKSKVKQYADALGQLMNFVKAFAQRLIEQMQSRNGGRGNEEQIKAMAKVQADMMIAAQKAKNLQASHAQRTAQRQVQFELEEQRKDRQLEADIQREAALANAEAENKRKEQEAKANGEKSETSVS